MFHLSLYFLSSHSPTPSLPPSLALQFPAPPHGRSKFLWNIHLNTNEEKKQKRNGREQKLKFHYLLRSSLGTQLVSALCGPGIFTALASPLFIVGFLSSRLADCAAITCSLPPAVWDSVHNYNISESSTCELEDGRRSGALGNDCIERSWQEECDHFFTPRWSLIKNAVDFLQCLGMKIWFSCKVSMFTNLWFNSSESVGKIQVQSGVFRSQKR